MATRPLDFSESFTFTIHTSPTRTTVKCWGRLTGEGAVIPEDETRSLIQTAKFIEIDLRAVTHLDASGASMLADLHVSAKSDGCHLKCKCEDGLVK
jgi:anti-anti-sigma regulatory factor